MRKKIVAGNWKMNLSSSDSIELFEGIQREAQPISGVDLVVFPGFLSLSLLVERSGLLVLGAQNAYPGHSGAFTGEVSLSQLKDLGVNHLIIGHSERRMLFHETNAFVHEKVTAAIDLGFTIFFCCGEPLDIRSANQEGDYVLEQLKSGLWHLNETQMAQVVIAYEPVWAIGTGQTATIEQAESMHAFIRNQLKIHFGPEVADQTSILYGGSCNPSNAKELFACQNVDGGLIGGASLDKDSFIQIAQSF
jgi:triosephosphate isomerase